MTLAQVEETALRLWLREGVVGNIMFIREVRDFATRAYAIVAIIVGHYCFRLRAGSRKAIAP